MTKINFLDLFELVHFWLVWFYVVCTRNPVEGSEWTKNCQTWRSFLPAIIWLCLVLLTEHFTAASWWQFISILSNPTLSQQNDVILKGFGKICLLIDPTINRTPWYSKNIVNCGFNTMCDRKNKPNNQQFLPSSLERRDNHVKARKRRLDGLWSWSLCSGEGRR
jgi:hypothetical protein